MTTLVLSSMNGSSSFLQIRRTTIKAWMSVIKNLHILTGKIFCDHSSAFFFEWIFLILACSKDTHKSLNELLSQNN